MTDTVSFDLYELMALEATLSPSEVSAGEGKTPSQAMPSRELCLKIGSALVQARETGGAVDLTLSEPECWILRERVSIFTSIGQRHDLGMAIKMKLYHLLLDYAFTREVGDLGTAEHQERSAREVRDALGFPEQRNYSSSDKDADGPKDGAHHKA